MIVRERPSGLRLFLTMRGSILPRADLPPPLEPGHSWLR